MATPADLQAALDASPAEAPLDASLSAQARFGIVFRLDGVVPAESGERTLAGFIEQRRRGESPP